MFSCRPFHDSLIISTYEINTFYISLQPWRGVFGTHLFSKLDKVCVNHRKKCLMTPDGKSRLDIAKILLNQSIYRSIKGVSRIRKLMDRQCNGQKLQDNNGIIKIQNRLRQATQVREYRSGIKKGQSRENGSKGGYKKQRHKTIDVGHPYAQTNTNNVSETCALLQPTGGKYVFVQKS